MNNKPLTISIVIPAYNEEDHIRSCLEALSHQTVQPLEVLLIDNNSSDQTVQIAREFAFVRVIKESKQGIVHARNCGFNEARGDIIGRIDADTVVTRGWVSYIVRYYQHPSHMQSALTGGCYMYDLSLPRFFGWLQGQVAFRMNRLILGHYITWGSNMALPKLVWEAVQSDLCLRTDIHEDLDLAIHLVRQHYSVTYHEGWKVGIDARVHHRHKRKRQLHYLKLWPKTLRVHRSKRAWMGELGANVIYWSYYPFSLLHGIAGIVLRK